MILNGTNLLTTYGLKLSYLDSNISYPARKKLLTRYEDYKTEARYYEGKKLTVTLIKKCTTKAQIMTIRDFFYNAVITTAQHLVTIPEHSIDEFTAVTREGAAVNITGNLIQVKITFTVV